MQLMGTTCSRHFYDSLVKCNKIIIKKPQPKWEEALIILD